MPGLFLQIASVVFFAVLSSEIISWLVLWEEKEYSLKRILIHLTDTKKGRGFIFGIGSFVKWALIFIYGITIVQVGFDSYYHVLVLSFYILILLVTLKKVWERSLVLPSLSVVNVVIFSFIISVALFLFVFAPLDHFFWILILDKLLPVFIALGIWLFHVIHDFTSDVVINKAISKIETRNDLLTIAVVGSYGRGSTKEFIDKVLSLKYNVLETRTTFSNALGISKTINSGLTSKKQIFIAEMDDYKRGEIGEMSNIISPNIAVVCGINEQKMATLGGIEQIIDSKQEVIDNLSRDGMVIINGNSNYSKRLYNKTKKKKFLYSVGEEKGEAQIYAANIKESKFALSFDAVVLGRRYRIHDIKLLGRQNIENLLPAIFIGVYVGIDFSELRKALSELRPLPGAMSPRETLKGVVLIDDTYNANINSVSRALSYMKQYHGKKVLVLEPLVELGKFSDEEHYKIGLEAGKVCDVLFLTNDNYLKSIKRGLKKSSSKCEVIVASPSKIINYITTKGKKGDVVVFEGRETKIALSYLRSEPIY